MIPIHDLSEVHKKELRMDMLGTLTHYDSTEPHRHNYFEFMVFLKGGGTHIIDFVEFPIQDYSIHIVAPGQVHQVKRALDSIGYVFIFELNLLEQTKEIENLLMNHICFEVTEFAPNYKFEQSFAEELIWNVEKAWKEYSSNEPFKSLVVQNHLQLLFMNCLRQKNVGNLNVELKNNDVYVNFRRMLNKEYKTLKKVKDYATVLSVSEKQLNDILHQRTGETVSSLIHKQLILEAKRLLNTGIPAKEVAYELNFIDPAHFSKFFKTQTGLSPSEFKNVQA
jgi:AraC family transcriptional regulator, transcriptional activator of pobA